MVQFIQLPQSTRNRLAEQLGTALGHGISKRFPDVQQEVQKKRLSQAFNDLRGADEGDFMAQFEAIAPTLMTTPGGSELLGTIAPLMHQRSKSQAIIKGKKGRTGKVEISPEEFESSDMRASPQKMMGDERRIERQDPSVMYQKPDSMQPYQEPVQPRTGTDPYFQYSQETAPSSSETMFPHMTAGPQPHKILSPTEINQRAAQMVEDSGYTIPENEAVDTLVRQNENARQYNEQIFKEQQIRKQELDETTNAMFQRAANSGLIDRSMPEEETMLRKLAYKYRNEATPDLQWQKTRDEFKKYAQAREGIKRAYDVPGGFGHFWRKMMGTFKEKEAVMNELQHPLKYFKENNMYDEARSLLGPDGLGFGPEDTEMTLFPLSQGEKQALQIFKGRGKVSGLEGFQKDFPSEKSILPSTEFKDFKETIGSYLSKNPNANLIVMRGRLNQGKGYAWQDISKGVNELIAEERFTPNQIQEGQLNIINQHPTPGLGRIFDFLWKKTK